MLFSTAIASAAAPGTAWVDRPEVLQSLAAAFERYEDALIHNKLDVLDELFWQDERTVRFGARENLMGFEQIRAFRQGRSSAGLQRQVLQRQLCTFGETAGTTHITFQREGEARVGRQSQTWVRFAAGWRVVAAHVSWMDA